jgi:Fic family protein
MTYDPRLTDAEYRSFPAFSDWARNQVDLVRWDRYSAVLEERGKVSAEQLAQAREVVKRAAAVDTGAIEGLYEADRGFTFTVATQAAIWEAAVDARGPRVRALIESQLRAYDYVLDVATQDRPISEVWIRTLHRELCAPQETYSVVTEVGVQTQALPLGEYKHLPNHVRSPSGEMHAYAPVDLVTAEMHRLCEILRSEEFLSAHPVLQASYAHYAFVVIHPFADGNGRVARALASVYTYRSHSIPLMILTESRKEYLDSLSAADGGNHQAFVDFVMERALDSILLVNESLGTALAPKVDMVRDEIQRLFTTRGGYTQEQVDGAGQLLFDLILEEFRTYAETLQDGTRLQVYMNKGQRQYDFTNPESRAPTLREWNVMYVNVQIGPPHQQSSSREFGISVPLDAGKDDDVSLVELDTSRRVFTARMSELVPSPTAALRMRISIAAQRIWGEAIADALAKVKTKVRQRGSEL